jgi:hypothetical protein
MSAGNPNPFDLLVEQIRAVVREEIAAAHVNGNGNGPSPTLLSAEAAAKCFCVPKKLDQRSGSPRRTALVKLGHYVRFKPEAFNLSSRLIGAVDKRLSVAYINPYVGKTNATSKKITRTDATPAG